MHMFNHDKLRQVMLKVLIEKSVPENVAQDVVNALVETSLRGTDSHGIQLFPHYSRVALSGRINRKPEITLLQRKASCAILDGDHGFGPFVGRKAMDAAISMAAETGVGAVAVSNSSHFAAAAYYGLQAAEKGYLGLCFTNADALVKVPGARQSFFGTNPICFCAPMMDEGPFCLDMATSQVAWNKVINHRRTGQELMPGQAYDDEGTMVVDANKAASLAPSGDYKGFGLGMMVEIFCGMLAGGPVATELTAMYVELEKRRSISHFMMALDIASFQPLDAFKTRLQEMAGQIRKLASIEGNTFPCVPGDPEKKCYASRVISGIPVDEEKFIEFKAVDEQFALCLM